MTADGRPLPDAAEIERRVLQFLHAEILPPGTAITRDRELLSGEVLDSMGVLRLAAFVEQAFGTGGGPSGFLIENFRTVGAIAEYVRRALTTGAARGD